MQRRFIDLLARAAIARSEERNGRAPFTRIVSIGDAPWDVRTAHRLGLPFVGVAVSESEVRLRREGAAHVLRDLDDAGDVLRMLEEARVPGSPCVAD